MALNFGVLQTASPVSAFYQGQQDVTRNALAQEQAAQEREMNALRRQQLSGQIAGQEETRRQQTRVQKAGLFRDRLLRAATPEAAREIVRLQYADPDLGQVLSQAGTLEQALAEVPDDPTQFETYRQQEAMGMGEWMKSQMPKITPRGDVFYPGTGQLVSPPQREVAPPPRKPVAVMINGVPTYVAEEEAVGKVPFTPATVKIMGAGAGGAPAAPAAPKEAPAKPMTQLQQQQLRKTMAADKTSVTAAETVTQELEKLTDELVGNPEKRIAPHPGLSGITGLQAMIPSLPSGNARKAQQRLDTLKGKVMAFGRQLASLEGKLGNMAVQEWKFVSDSIQAIDPAAGNLDTQLRDIVRQAKNFANNVKQRYDMTYEGAGEAPAAGAGAGGLTPEEQAELDQLRQRFGRK